MQMKDIKKQLKQKYGYVLQKEISDGGTCRCYRLKNQLILKLFESLTPFEYIEREFNNMNFLYSKCPAMFPKPYEIICIEDSDSTVFGIVMERLESISLYSLNLYESVLLFYEITEALGIMHKYGFTHCDIKSENIMKKHNRYVLIDFGVSQYSDSRRTVVNPHFFGISFLNCPPEYLFKNMRQFSSRGDIYALAMTMRLACKARYDNIFAQQIERSRLNNDTDRIIRLKQNLIPIRGIDTRFSGFEDPYMLDNYCRILNKCLEPERHDRYQKTDLLLTDLCKLLRGGNNNLMR